MIGFIALGIVMLIWVLSWSWDTDEAGGDLGVSQAGPEKRA